MVELFDLTFQCLVTSLISLPGCEKGRWNLPGVYLSFNDVRWLLRVGALYKHILVIIQPLSLFFQFFIPVVSLV